MTIDAQQISASYRDTANISPYHVCMQLPSCCVRCVGGCNLTSGWQAGCAAVGTYRKGGECRSGGGGGGVERGAELSGADRGE
jgi:hypothetical protein